MDTTKLEDELDKIEVKGYDEASLDAFMEALKKEYADEYETLETVPLKIRTSKKANGFKICRAYIDNSASTWDFAGRHTLILPNSLQGTVNAVKYVEKEGKKLKCLGSKHSFSYIPQSDDIYFDLRETYDYSISGHNKKVEKLDFTPLERLKDTIKKENFFNAPAGMKISMINHILCPDKRRHKLIYKDKKRMFNMGGGDVQTIAGAFSTGTHGSGGIYSAYHDMIRSIELVASGGKVYRVEPNDGITDPMKHQQYYNQHQNEVQVELIQDDDHFYSLLVSMGCFGIIYSVIMEISDMTLLHEEATYVEEGWNVETKNKLTTPILPQNPNEEIFNYIQINPYVIKGNKNPSILIKEAKPTTNQASGKKIKNRNHWPQFFAKWGVSAKIIRILANHGKMPKANLIEKALKSQNDNKDKGKGYTDLAYKVWNAGSGKLKSYGTGIEFCFPTEQISEVVDLLLATMRRVGNLKRGYYLNAPLALRFVRPSKGYLAPNFHLDQEGNEVKEWCYLEVLRINGASEDTDAKELEIYKHLQGMLALLGGRPHWGLNFGFNFTFKQLQKMYPNFNKWYASYKFFNSSNLFQNRFTREAGLDDVLEELPA